MPCYHPLKGFRSRSVGKSGKRKIVFNTNSGFSDMPVQVPCGQCIGCRLERSRQWAVRCVHEAQLHSSNCFITLTFSDAGLALRSQEYEDAGFPDPLFSLSVRDYQLFMKRLRFRFGKRIRYYHCGEYGEKYGRPHYHACIFGFDFPDKVFWKRVDGSSLFISKELDDLWPYGFATIGDVSFKSAAYVARYIMKKVNGDLADSHYETVDEITGEVYFRAPEYTTMSRRPGIASDWFRKYSSDVYPDDFVVMNDTKIRPPRYYDFQYESLSPVDFARIKCARIRAAKKYVDNNTPERLNVRERVKHAQISFLKRSLDREI